MTHTDCGTRVPWEWCPLALANGIEWGANEFRYERLYAWDRNIAMLPNHVLYVIGWLWAKLHAPKWAVRKGR